MEPDFKNMLPRPFEQLVQALGVRFLASGLEVFGDGADGGREAAFRGKMAYPTAEDPWNGYVVVQAKLKARLESPSRDASWLANQLKSEFEKFLDAEKGLTRPEYYVIATNVRLSSGQSKGRKSGHAKIEEIFSEYAQRLGLKGYAVWHHDKLRAMLDGAEDIRRQYTCWITPDDVLNSALAAFNVETPDFSETIRLYLARQLRENRDIRLQQAGHGEEGGTQLHEVFVDLPCHEQASAEGSPESGPDTSARLLSFLVGEASAKLDPRMIAATRDAARQRGVRCDLRDRVLVLGGPGQGKSTISQFLAQLFRARCLQHQPLGSIQPEISAVARHTILRAEAEGISATGVDRFPVRVDLPEFADQLAKGECTSLLAYIARDIATTTDRPIGTELLRRWLAAYPWLLLLDGLDEVPRSANRAAAIKCITEFSDEINSCQADVFQVVLTRPQGYNEEFSKDEYPKVTLSFLSKDDAHRYGQALAGVQITQETHRARVMVRLASALQNNTTSRLLISPLQVAIMIALLDKKGEAPSDRWSLFDGYYHVIVDRERSKPGPVSDIIRDRAREIDAIHQSCGYLLQLESGRAGETESFLSPSRFREIVRAFLAQEDHEGPELDRLVDAISEASTDRLVFLTSRVEGRVAFDVRSLQEFMAASKIMSSRPEFVAPNLRAISGYPHWRHVLQIAASKCFSVADISYYRDTIVALCDELNASSDDTDRLVKTGAYIALNLLEDGLAQGQPRYYRTLISLALGVVEQGLEAVSDSLVDLCAAEVSQAIVDERLRALSQRGEVHVAQAACALLARLYDSGCVWAGEALADNWPDHIQVAAPAIQILANSSPSTRVQALLNASVDRMSTNDVVNFVRSGGVGTSHNYAALVKRFPFIDALKSTYRDGGRLVVEILPNENGAVLESALLPHDSDLWAGALPTHVSWDALRLAGEFASNPSAETLSSALERLAAQPRLNFSFLEQYMPWPLATILTEHEDLNEASKLVSAGAFGDVEQWAAAELDFQMSGASLRRLSHWKSGRHFDKSVATEGFPLPDPLWLSSSKGERSTALDELIELRRDVPPSAAREHLSRMILFMMESYQSPLLEDPAEVAGLFAEAAQNERYHLNVGAIGFLSPGVQASDEIANVLDSAGRQDRLTYYYRQRFPGDTLVAMLKSDPSRSGIVPFLLAGLENNAFTTLDLARVPTAALNAEESDSDLIALSKIVLKCFRNAKDKDVDRASELLKTLEANTLVVKFICEVAVVEDHLESVRENLLRAVRASSKLDPANVARTHNGLQRARANRKLELRTPSTWKSLGIEDYLLRA